MTGGRGVDVVLDHMGAKYLSRNVDPLAVGGRLVVIGLIGGGRVELDLAALQAKLGAVHATRLRSRPKAEKAAVAAAGMHGWSLPLLRSLSVVEDRRWLADRQERIEGGRWPGTSP